jgi:hypothetical protein
LEGKKMAKTTKRKSFIFNIEWQEVLLEYPAEVRLEVYDAIIEYVASGTLSELKPMARIAFSFIKKEIDYNEQRYQDVVNKRSEAGKRSAESRNNNKSTNSTNVNKCQQASTNATDNVNDNDIVNDLKERELSNDNPPKKETSSFPQAEPKFFEDDKPSEKIDYDRIVDLYHKACPSYPKLIKLSDKRKAKIRVRFEEMKYDYQTMATIFCKMEASKFLKGDNKNGWKATFDWVLENANNWVKVLEGQYDNKQEQKPTSSPPAGVQLGYGERIVDGRRTYGTGKSTIPMNAPPRPGDGYSWSAEANKWVY